MAGDEPGPSSDADTAGEAAHWLRTWRSKLLGFAGMAVSAGAGMSHHQHVAPRLHLG